MQKRTNHSPLRTMILAVAALLCLTLFQNCERTGISADLSATSHLKGHQVVPSSVVVTFAKSAHYSK